MNWSSLQASLLASLQTYLPLLIQGTKETVLITLASTFISYLLGLPLGLLVVATQENGVLPKPNLNRVLQWAINIGRSIPFIILLVALIPFTRLIVGTSIGTKATIVPLVIAATPFVARMVESSVNELDAGIIEAAQAMGATPWQIISKVMLPESIPSIILGSSVTSITLVGYSAMAGAIGSGGLGNLAIRYGYHRYQSDMMILTIILLVILVQILQSTGSMLSRKLDKRRR
jgi:D-methionine transport system permease protein